MKTRSVIARVLIALLALLLFALAAAMAWAVVIDYQARSVVPVGVKIVGYNLSGMSEAHARDTIEHAVSTPLLRPVTVTGDGKLWILDPKPYVTVDIDGMFDDAYLPRRSAALLARLDNQLRAVPLTHDVKPAYSVDTSGLAAWVAQTATEVDRKPVNATRTFVAKKYSFTITPAVYGATVDQATSTQQIANLMTAEAALSGADRSTTLTISMKTPKVLESSFKNAIAVSLNRCKIYLYNGDKLVKVYSCAPGQPAWPTPKGDFKIVSKQANAPWYNPHSSWSASMPDVIPGGPGNPMGDRKIGINWAGVFFHGVPPGEYGSIGSHASHGCMRMMPSAVHDMYGRVKIGDPVYIRE
jgi:lipoprotein-anchoring transpeptidase ErfK/SrfK